MQTFHSMFYKHKCRKIGCVKRAPENYKCKLFTRRFTNTSAKRSVVKIPLSVLMPTIIKATPYSNIRQPCSSYKKLYTNSSSQIPLDDIDSQPQKNVQCKKTTQLSHGIYVRTVNFRNKSYNV